MTSYGRLKRGCVRIWIVQSHLFSFTRYIQYEDGFFRLQMVRFESVELTKRLYGDQNEEATEDSIQPVTVAAGIPNLVEHGGDNINTVSNMEALNVLVAGVVNSVVNVTGEEHYGEGG